MLEHRSDKMLRPSATKAGSAKAAAHERELLQVLLAEPALVPAAAAAVIIYSRYFDLKTVPGF